MRRNGVQWVCCAVAISAGLCARAQTGLAEPSFEVATVKQVDPSYHFDGKHHWAHVTPTGASYWYMSLGSLISYAYDVDSFQVAGPEWTSADRFDIEAKFPEGADRRNERKMLQALLKERFKLAFHIEKRELEGYVLVVGKHGEKLKPSVPDVASPEAAAGEAPARAKAIHNQDGSSTIDLGKSGTETFRLDRETSVMHYEFSKMTMQELRSRLSVCLGGGVQHIEDETGLKGEYQVTWDCPMAIARPPAAGGAAGVLPPDPQDGSVLSRSLDAIGLKVEKRKMPREVYVIDHVERPSEN